MHGLPAFSLTLAYLIPVALLALSFGTQRKRPRWLIAENGYGHSNAKSFDLFTDEELAALGLSRNPADILSAGKFQVPQTQEFETAMNEEFEKIKSGF